MIRLILNGYYRAGTTLLYRIIRDSNPDMLHLYEPLTPDIKDKIFWTGDLSLHGFNAYRCYLDERIDLEKFLKIHSKLKNSGDVIPVSLGEVKPLFDFFNDIQGDVTLQPNRCHLILKELSEEYECPVIHIIRNPVDTWISQVYTPLIKEMKATRYKLAGKVKPLYRFILTRYIPNRKWCNGFYIKEDYEILNRHFRVPEAKSPLDKMIVAWTFFNYQAAKQADSSDRILVIYYEKFANDPEKWMKKMDEFSGVKFDLNHSKTVKAKITRDEKLRELFIRRIEGLNLMEMVEETYLPTEWFG